MQNKNGQGLNFKAIWFVMLHFKIKYFLVNIKEQIIHR